jgi:hypothetical protein
MQPNTAPAPLTDTELIGCVIGTARLDLHYPGELVSIHDLEYHVTFLLEQHGRLDLAPAARAELRTPIYA